MAVGRPSVRASREAKKQDAYRKAAKRLGDRIKALREKRGSTLEDAAEGMDLDAGYLQKIEKAKFNVTLVTLVRVAQGLNVSLESLFEGGPVLRSTASQKGVRKRRRAGGPAPR